MSRYKQVPKKPDEPATFSFVQLVTRWGDDWRSMVPPRYEVSLENYPNTQDAREAMLMKLMERGEYPRVDYV